ncbi:MAG: hypothetical protein ACJAS1_000566 [Oleiphilaceae bacterium]|jgi:hypothetical protein
MDFKNYNLDAVEKVNPLIKDQVIVALELEWGSGAQMEAQDKVFDLCIVCNVFTYEDAEKACHMATTQEMMRWVGYKCVDHVNGI